MNNELKPMSFGQIIGSGINLYLKNFVQLVLISGVCTLITIPSLYNYTIATVAYTNALKIGMTTSANSMFAIMGPYFSSTGIYTLFTIIASGIIVGFIVEFTSRKYLDKDTSFGSIFKNVLPGILPLIGLSLLLSLIIGIGCIFLLFPGIILMAMFALAPICLILEKKGVFEAMGRSKELTTGNKGRLFLMLVIVGIFTFIISAILSRIIPHGSSPIATTILSYLTAAILTPVQLCILVLYYFDQRVKKEGFDIQHLAEQYSFESPTKS